MRAQIAERREGSMPAVDLSDGIVRRTGAH
jgi:hypothetical protein